MRSVSRLSYFTFISHLKTTKSISCNLFDQFLERKSEKIPTMIYVHINIHVIQKTFLKSKYIATEANGFQMISKEATRIAHTSQTCIDHVITQNIQRNVNVHKQQSSSDHEALSVTWHTIETKIPFYRDFVLRKAELFEWYSEML